MMSGIRWVLSKIILFVDWLTSPKKPVIQLKGRPNWMPRQPAYQSTSMLPARSA